MRWTALVPLKLDDRSKSRLADILTAPSRTKLVTAMARHVLGVLGEVSGVERIVVLAPHRPDWWHGDWADDCRAGLNEAVTAWRSGHGTAPVLVIHGDLPYLAPADVATLLEAAEATGAALATDRARAGTNAIALADRRPFVFAFGPGSKAAHMASSDAVALVERPGLAQDIDTPSELAALMEAGIGTRRSRDRV